MIDWTWYCIDMASYSEDRYVLDPSRGRWACRVLGRTRPSYKVNDRISLVVYKVATITLRVRDLEQSSCTL